MNHLHFVQMSRGSPDVCVISSAFLRYSVYVHVIWSAAA